MRGLLFCLLFALGICVDVSGRYAPTLAVEIDFARQIKPLLSENCFFCHGPDAAQRQADLRLDVAAEASKVIKSGDRSSSELYLRLVDKDVNVQMPPPSSHRKLSAEQIELIGRWIDQGASWGEHWSFRPLTPPALPKLQPAETKEQSTQIDSRPIESIRNEIDLFVQERLLHSPLRPNPEADRRTLIRRLSLDLTGLPPTLSQVEWFVSNDDPTAYEQLVDRLLAAPELGQRMAWDWLEAARYADTNGYQGDNERTMWPWRDWIVAALNDNMPFDQFTIWQLAGDLLPDPTPEQLLATGFLRNHPINGEGGRIAEENRVEYVFDMAETTATVWLGLTLNCCRCHDHKYDPLTNQDYFRFFAFFDKTPVTGKGGDPQTPPNLAVPSAEQVSLRNSLSHEMAELRKRIGRIEQSYSQNLVRWKCGDRSRPDSTVTISQKYGKLLPDAAPENYYSAVDALQGLIAQTIKLDREIPRVMIMRDSQEPRESFALTRGLYNQPTNQVDAGTPSFMFELPQDEPFANAGSAASDRDVRERDDRQLDGSPKANRLLLARWLVDSRNPLPARVAVNRVWQQLFGIGLVATSEDFGVQGEVPKHLQLLDWLSSEFVASGWDVKSLLRKIVTSHTYRQSSKFLDPLQVELDPQNRWLSRSARHRLPSWMIRDQALAAAGLLSSVRSGPAVNSYQPAGVWEEASFGKKVYKLGQGEQLYRRSLFTFWRRIVAPTMFFDSATRQTCTVKNSRTNTPLHALLTLNDITYVEAAKHLAERALQVDGDGTSRLDAVFLRLLARPASPSENKILLSGLERTRSQFSQSKADAELLLSVGESACDPGLNPVEHASWTALCLAVLNLDETLNRE